jgi:hypothetical protein
MYLHFYVYAYLRKDGTPYYIGKGSGDRVWNKNKGEVRPPKDKSLVIIVEKNLTDIGSLAIERRLIKWYGRKDLGTGILRNKTDGGDGRSGFKLSEESKLKISKALTGRKHTDNAKQKISKARLGKPHPQRPRTQEEINRLISVRPSHHSEETRKKISDSKKGNLNPFYGKSHTDETKQKMSKALSGKNNPNFGKITSDEAKRKISESQKRRLAEKRLKSLQSSNEA